jgi:hypothetical protein
MSAFPKSGRSDEVKIRKFDARFRPTPAVQLLPNSDPVAYFHKVGSYK